MYVSDGIDIENWQLDIKLKDGEEHPAEISVWDFAGFSLFCYSRFSLPPLTSLLRPKT